MWCSNCFLYLIFYCCYQALGPGHGGDKQLRRWLQPSAAPLVIADILVHDVYSLSRVYPEDLGQQQNVPSIVLNSISLCVVWRQIAFHSAQTYMPIILQPLHMEQPGACTPLHNRPRWVWIIPPNFHSSPYVYLHLEYLLALSIQRYPQDCLSPYCLFLSLLSFSLLLTFPYGTSELGFSQETGYPLNCWGNSSCTIEVNSYLWKLPSPLTGGI